MSVPLKKPADESRNVPSWLKCSCHHSGSVVVTIDKRMPPTSTTNAPAPKCIVVSPAAKARGEGTTRRRDSGAAALEACIFHPGRTRRPPDCEPPKTPSTRRQENAGHGPKFAPQRDGKPSSTWYPPEGSKKLRDIRRAACDSRGAPAKHLSGVGDQRLSSMPHSRVQLSPGARRRRPAPVLKALPGAVIGSMASARGRSG